MKQIVHSGEGELGLWSARPHLNPAYTGEVSLPDASMASPATGQAGAGSFKLFLLAEARPDIERRVVSMAGKDRLRFTVDTARAEVNGDLRLGSTGVGVIPEVRHVAAPSGPEILGDHRSLVIDCIGA